MIKVLVARNENASVAVGSVSSRVEVAEGKALGLFEDEGLHVASLVPSPLGGEG